MLANLVINSLDAVPVDGKVTLRAAHALRRDGKAIVRITIADNGLGINSVALAQIFTPFFTTKGSVGNGLGLWVSKQIIEKHGGSIQVRSRTSAPSRGTTFSIVFPEKPV